jgi:hypothetical protein
MEVSLIIALVQALGPGAISLIDTFMKDKNAVYTPEMWNALKLHVPFEQLAGPK